MTKKLAVALPLMIVMAIGIVSAQEGENTTIPRLDGDEAAAAPAAANNSVFIICCDANPKQMLVLDSTGKWMSTVRSAKVDFGDIGEGVPKVSCTMWSGPFKPTNPEVKEWTLAQLKSVTTQEFQQMVDSLQSDPEAIRRQISN